MPSNYAESLSNMNAMYKSMMEMGISPGSIENTEFALLVDLFKEKADNKKAKQPTQSAEDFLSNLGGPKAKTTEVDASKFKNTSTVRTR